MATLTNAQIEAKKQQLKQLAKEAQQLKNELVEAGAWPLDEDSLDNVAGGLRHHNEDGTQAPRLLVTSGSCNTYFLPIKSVFFADEGRGKRAERRRCQY